MFTGSLNAFKAPVSATGGLRTCVVIAAAVAVFGCKEGLRVSIVDAGNRAPIFQVSHLSPLAIEQSTMSMFAVYQFGSDGRVREVLWELRSTGGELQRLDRIKYGVVPDGFEEARTAQMLISGVNYVAEAGAPGKSGGISFVLQ